MLENELKESKKEQTIKCNQIIKRAIKEDLCDERECLDLQMDIESACLCFNMDLDTWLNADSFNFAHDIIGIRNNIVRNEFPSTDFGEFVPRYAGK